MSDKNKAKRKCEGSFRECTELELELVAKQTERISKQLSRECSGLSDPAAVSQKTREVLEETQTLWKQRIEKMRMKMDEESARAWESMDEMSPEMKWAKPSVARRMLRANLDNGKNAVAMFVQALDFRAQHRRLFQTMSIEAKTDMRVMARDKENRPVVYMCFGSQTAPVREIRDELMVTFEKAARLAGHDGQMSFIVDMHGHKPYLNCNPTAIKEISDILGTVFAERICRVWIVDFARAAQVCWMLLKPLLMPATREKFAFINRDKALELCREQFDAPTVEKVSDTFKINRDPNASQEERAAHALRTSIGEETPIES
jgi:hypothetical protein